MTDADRELMVEPLRSALGDTNWQVRLHGATALGHLGDARTVEDLIGMLDDEDHRVRCFTAQALGNLGDRRAIQPLRRALADSDAALAIKEALAKLTR
ncbi:HEAT repeat domain-containing protein [Streptomyces phaeochromogenes]|uniref:HEAT repeat domain-containing protein n=1 Tax=Streptomyces phaeochromogenes TaxID=1923 RepID=UPI003254CB7D